MKTVMIAFGGATDINSSRPSSSDCRSTNRYRPIMARHSGQHEDPLKAM